MKLAFPVPGPVGFTLLLLLAAQGCSKDGAPPEEALFPVRLLPQSQEEIYRPLLQEAKFEQRHLEDWSILSSREGQVWLDPAGGDPRVSVEGGILRLEDPRGSLVRLLELPPQRFLQVNIDLAPAGPIDLHAGCDRFFMLGAGPLAKDESIEDLVARGLKPPSREDPITLEQFLDYETRFQQKRPRQSWVRPVDRAGFAGASFQLMTGEEREAYALVVPAGEVAARIRSFEILERPDRRKQLLQIDGGLSGATPVKLFGVHYLSALVPPGESLVLKEEIPEGAETLSFHVGLDPRAPPGATARWTVEVETGAGQFQELGRGALTMRKKAPARFEEQTFQWPEEVALAAPQVRFLVEGQAGLFVGQPMVRGPAASERPNLLFVSIDTLRAGHLGCYGYERPTSPFLDSLAKRSALFLNFRSVAPYTLPTHATLLTGLMPVRHGAVRNSDRLDASRVAYLPQVLADSGYVTAAFTSGGFLSLEFGFQGGFDRFGSVDPILPDDADPSGSSAWFRQLRAEHDLGAVSRWIESHRRESWFLFLHTFLVHEYEAPEADLARFRTVPDGVLDEPPAKYLQGDEWVDNMPPGETVEYLRNLYDGTIHFADRSLAELFQRLEGQGLLENTIVVVVGDHGEEFGDHGGLVHSATLYEEMLRVPLLVHLPGGDSRRVIREPVSQADLAPTLLDLLGLPALDQLDGHSRASLVRDGTPSSGTTPVYAQVDSVTSCRSSLQVGSLKIIRGDQSLALERPAPAAWQLFDLESDPLEQEDLAEKQPGRLEEMKEHLRKYEAYLQERAILGSRADIGPELQRRLEELGY
ncbi:MAG: sulfatase [Planctomycetota bacterium]